jgi:hypothetical protein
LLPQRAAPLVLAVAPSPAHGPFGSYSAVAAGGVHLLAAELSQRLGRLGAAVAPLEPTGPGGDDAPFHWGRWFAAAANEALQDADRRGNHVDAIGYAGAGALALLDDTGLEQLLTPIPGEVVGNNRFSADAFVVAGAGHATEAPDGTARRGPSLERALDRLEACPSDNAAVRCLESAGFRSRDLADLAWSRFDVDTPLDLALLRLSTRLRATRKLDPAVAGYLEMARLPGDRELLIPELGRIAAVIRDPTRQLVLAGRIPSSVLRELETEAACRIRAFVEERGMRSARGSGPPRSFLARWVEEEGATSLVAELSTLGDAVVLDTRVVMAALAGSAESDAWPPREERFASDFMDGGPIQTPWLRELVEAARHSAVPFLFGGHSLVSDGIRLVLAAAWLGR